MPLETTFDAERFRAEFVDDVLSKLSEAVFESRMSASDIAKATGLSQHNVEAVLSGEHGNPGIDAVALIARAMGFRPELVLHSARPEGGENPERLLGQVELDAFTEWGERTGVLGLDPAQPITGFFAGLTPEQQAAALAYDGPENFGPDEFRFDADNERPTSALVMRVEG